MLLILIIENFSKVLWNICLRPLIMSSSWIMLYLNNLTVNIIIFVGMHSGVLITWKTTSSVVIIRLNLIDILLHILIIAALVIWIMGNIDRTKSCQTKIWLIALVKGHVIHFLNKHWINASNLWLAKMQFKLLCILLVYGRNSVRLLWRNVWLSIKDIFIKCPLFLHYQAYSIIIFLKLLFTF